MAENFVELGAEGINYVTEKYWDNIHDTVAPRVSKAKQGITGRKPQDAAAPPPPPPDQAPASAVSGSVRRKQKNRLPSPEGSIDSWEKDSYRSATRDNPRSPSLDRESQRSEQVIRAYEADPRDPPARPETVLPRKDLNQLRRDSRMSYGNGGNGYASSNLAPGGYDSRRQSHSQQPPRSRYYDDDDSDYDERTGQRYRASGRGYDDRYDDDDYAREVVTTERYKGPARNAPDRRESYGTRGYNDEQYGAGAVTQYNRRSNTEVDDYRSRRSQSRGRRDRDRDSRSRSGSRSRSRSHEGIRGKIDDTFDTSMQGLGVGLAGAVVGGLAGREFGHRHKNRDIIIGALIGGLGANAAENKWRDWKDDKKRDIERDEDRIEQKWDGRDYGRSRSAMR